MTSLLVLAILGLFYETAWSMVSIWYRSETFAHGFIIVPITLWLIWEKRSALKPMAPQPEYRVLLLLLGGGFLWLAGYLADALVVQQLALVSILIFAVWTLLGNRITWALAFPLAFLFFAVPMGEDLVPPLMEVTATATVYLVKLTGIPVYREGLFFSLPSGDWSVVEACSGIRYLIASVTLGCLYAYLTYDRLGKRIIFIIVAALVPIAANAVRAYIIVMLGHLSDMKIATGVDHLIYGWFFFGIVMMILFWIGSIWRDKEIKSTWVQHTSFASGQKIVSNVKLLTASILSISITAIWPVLAVAIDDQVLEVSQAEIETPDEIASWSKTSEEFWQWKAMFIGADKRVDHFYRNGSHRVMLSAGQYVAQAQGKEMINSQNLLVDPTLKAWRVVGAESQSIRIGEETVSVDVSLLSGEGRKLLVWSWYRVGTLSTANPYVVKIYESFLKLTFNRSAASKVVYSIEVEDERRLPTKILEEFITASYPILKNSLDQITASK